MIKKFGEFTETVFGLGPAAFLFTMVFCWATAIISTAPSNQQKRFDDTVYVNNISSFQQMDRNIETLEEKMIRLDEKITRAELIIKNMDQ